MTYDFIYDEETMPNVFTIGIKLAGSPLRWSFEISPWRNDSREIINTVRWIGSIGGRMVGFNNLSFDYALLHFLMQMGNADAPTLYNKAMAIIGSQDGEDRWSHIVKPTDRHVPQIDLFKLHHLDNKARATSLKVLEFNMRMFERFFCTTGIPPCSLP